MTPLTVPAIMLSDTLCLCVFFDPVVLFTKSALHEVQVALMLSVLMVALVMLVFLRRIGPMLIAMLSVPLSLAGAFAVMWTLGYTLNTLSLIALVLCIGFVVDDAIVVIENIVRHMEQGAPPLQAALAGVKEIGFTVVSITLSLIAVFAPLLFGNNQFTLLLREFSVTLTAAVVISAIVSLSITPALCGRFLPAEESGTRVAGAIESYSEIIRWLDDKDPTTRTLLETILAVEEEHANDMLSLLEDLGDRLAVALSHTISPAARDHDLRRDLIDRAGELGQISMGVEQRLVAIPARWPGTPSPSGRPSSTAGSDRRRSSAIVGWLR